MATRGQKYITLIGGQSLNILDTLDNNEDITNQKLNIVCDTTNGFPINILLPDIAAFEGFTNFELTVDDKGGNAAAANINILTSGTNKINGAASAMINSDNGKMFIQISSTTDWSGFFTFSSVNPNLFWKTAGNALTGGEFIGTTSNDDFVTKVNNIEVIRVTKDGAGLTRMYINADTNLHGSNAGIQYSSIFANRSQLRTNAYGNHGGVSGVTGFKSRGTNIGDLASLVPGDTMFRITAIGVSGDNASINLAALVDLKVSPGGVFPAYVATDFTIDLMNLAGVRSQKLILNSEGNLGLGIAIPTNRLHVKGDTDLLGNTILRVENLSNNCDFRFNDDGNIYINSPQYTGIQWQVAGVMATQIITTGVDAVKHRLPADWTWVRKNDDFILGGKSGVNWFFQAANNTAITPTSKVDIEGENGYNQLRLRKTFTPANSADANGNIGDLAWDPSFLYIKVTGLGWTRATLATF